MRSVQTRSRYTVLVVEDEPLVRFHVSEVLDQSGFTVVESSNPIEALAVISERPDVCVVVSDVVIPGYMDGFELARCIRRERPGVGVVLISGQRTPSARELPRHVRFLSKPVKASALLRVVRQVT